MQYQSKHSRPNNAAIPFHKKKTILQLIETKTLFYTEKKNPQEHIYHFKLRSQDMVDSCQMNLGVLQLH